MTELLVYGVVLGSIMALGAIGLTLLYGVLRFAHFAHGDLMTLGAYVVLLLNVELLPALGIPELKLGALSFGGRMLGSLVVSMGVTALVALLIDRILYHPLRARRSSPASSPSPPGDGLYPAQPDLYRLGTPIFCLFPRTAARMGAPWKCG